VRVFLMPGEVGLRPVLAGVGGTDLSDRGYAPTVFQGAVTAGVDA
jgi:hypothetical protein